MVLVGGSKAPRNCRRPERANGRPGYGRRAAAAHKKSRRGGLSATAWFRNRRFEGKQLDQTSSLRAPISVRNRSASKAASNGFLNVSLMLERSKLVELPSSGSKAIKIVSAYSGLRRRFWQICNASTRPIEKSTMMQSGWK